MECKHETLVNQRRQIAVKNTLIIKDCAGCGTTLTVAIVDHSPEEAAKMAALVKSIKGE